MSIKTQLNESMKDAMRSGDEVRKRTVRMALAAVKQVEVDKRVELDDAAVMSLLQKEIKNRREALEEAKKANRPDLIEENEAEIKVLQAFLPEAMPAEELRALVQAAITETGAASPSDMGKVMKVVLAKVAGRAPNDMVSATVREFLQK
jgi:uncharacterized protein YqeY